MKNIKNILVSGGAGFIGTHTVIELFKAGYHPVVVDNLSNSSIKAMNRVEEIIGEKVCFYEMDLRDEEKLCEVFEKEQIDACIHFAGLKAVAESVEKPLEYYSNNLNSTLVLLKLMQHYGVHKFVFSSSATVYGDPAEIPITENCPKGKITNPYGQTKGMIEQILCDVYRADSTWDITLLRYFNPIGAHESGKIGENPNGIPNNLVPYITQVAVGKLPTLQVYGDDYDTPDGTGVRDYIHVVDLAKGHIKALNQLKESTGLNIYNLGTGQGYSVLQIVNAFRQVTGIDIPYVITKRRPGDIATCYADASKAERELGWKAEKDLKQMCEDAWRWQKNNPEGF